jgi:CubicO group peptidase (beta-lactamase class C family)
VNALGSELTLRDFGTSSLTEYGLGGNMLTYGNAVYSTIEYFGSGGYGVVFRFQPSTNSYTIMHAFGYTHGGWPLAITLSGSTL